MKKILFLCFFLMGCEDPNYKSEEVRPLREELSEMRLVAKRGWTNVYVVEIDGADYIVVVFPEGGAVCPVVRTLDWKGSPPDSITTWEAYEMPADGQ